MLARLNSCLFKPLLKHIEDRAESIKEDLGKAKNNSADVDGMLAEANENIANAKKEAAAIRQKAFDEATVDANKKLVEAKKDVDNKYNSFLSELEVEVNSLKASLSSDMPVFEKSLQAKIKNI
jgi:F-type H+-transporting ATPase subunit b